jgi:hypothetical protein
MISKPRNIAASVQADGDDTVLDRDAHVEVALDAPERGDEEVDELGLPEPVLV